jgi:signal transduction histidine kinase
MSSGQGWSARLAAIDRAVRQRESLEEIFEESVQGLSAAGAVLLVYRGSRRVMLAVSVLSPELRQRVEARLGALTGRVIEDLPAALKGLPGEARLVPEPGPGLFAACLGADASTELPNPPGAAVSFILAQAGDRRQRYVMFAPGLGDQDLAAVELFFSHLATLYAHVSRRDLFASMQRLSEAARTFDPARLEREAAEVLLRTGALESVCFYSPGPRRRFTLSGALPEERAARLVEELERAGLGQERELVEVLESTAPEPVRRALLDAGLRSAAVTRLGSDAEAGLVLLGRLDAEPLASSDLSLLRAFCVSLASSMEAARLYAESRTQVNDFKRLFLLGRAVAGEEELPRVFKLAAQVSADLVRADDVFLFTPGSEDAEEPGLVARTCLHLDTTEGPPAQDPDGAELVAEARALALVTLRQRTAGAGRERLGRGSGGACLAAVPIFMGERPAGCLVARRSTDEEVEFEPADVQRLHAVADYLSAAMQSAALVAEQQRRVRELVLLNAIASDCGVLGLDRLLPAVTERIAQAMSIDLAALLFFDPSREELVTGAVASREGRVLGPGGGTLVQPGLCLRVLAGRRPQRGSADELGLPELQALAAGRHVKSATVLPLLVKDKAIGVIVAMRESRAFGDDELRMLTAICSEIAVSVENARLFAEAERRAEDLELVQGIGEAIARSLDSRLILKEATERLCQVLDCDTVRVYVRADAEFVCQSQWGLPPRYSRVGTRLPVDSPVIASALNAQTCGDVPIAELPEATRAFIAKLGLARLAAVPLRISEPMGGEVQHVGTLLLGRRAPRPFGPADLSVLGAVGTQLAVALKNAQLHEQTRRRVEDLSIVSEAGRVLLEEKRLPDVLDGVAARLARLVSTRGCYVLLWDEEAKTLGDAGVSEQTPPALKRLRLPLEEIGSAARAVTERVPVQERQLADEPWARRFEQLLGWKAESAFALPLLSGDRVMGVILLVDDQRGRLLSKEEIDRAMAIGHQVAIAIARARLNVALASSYEELGKTQAQLVQRERLAALGELAALVAHEVRNPLGVIFNSLGSLQKLVAFEGDARRLYEIIREEAVQLNGIVGDLLDFTRPTLPQLASVRLERVVREAAESARTSERSRGTAVDLVETAFAFEPDMPPVPMDERMIRQAVVNLLSNAYQSLPRGGHVVVGTRQVRENGASRARLTVRDDGSGVAAEARPRLFEPFFTTKAAGSGLGLAMVKRIVDAHGGEVSVATAPGEGTTFVLDLPLESAEASRAD